MSHFDRCFNLALKYVGLGMDEPRIGRLLMAVGAGKYFMPWEIPVGRNADAWFMRAMMRS